MSKQPAALPGYLASLVGSRLCHDLVSPLGAIGNGVELLHLTPEYAALAASPEIQLIDDSIEAARVRINWFRVAFGHASPEQRLSAVAMQDLVQAMDQGGRIRIRFDAEGDLPRSDGRLILLAVMCLETAMPWGGRILICRGDTGWRLVAEAERMRPDPSLWAWLSPGSEREISPREPAPSQVHFALLAHFANEAQRRLNYELDEGGAEIAF